MLRFDYGARSDIGLVRANNEDAGFAGPYLQLVADGVGGAAAGEVASATTGYIVSALAAARPDDDPVTLLTDAVGEAHRQLHAAAAAETTRAGMGTTLTAALARDGYVTLAHVGDSRGYLMRTGRLTRLTTDHSFVQTLIDAGRLTAAEAKAHPYRSVVHKTVNAEELQAPDVWRFEVEPGDRLLLCTDGLSDFVDEADIAALLRAGDPDSAAGALVDAALAAGGRDNVTCLVADVAWGPALVPGGHLLGAMFDPFLVVDPAAVRLGRPA